MTGPELKVVDSFPGKVFDKDKKTALAYASAVYDTPLSKNKAHKSFILWTDASVSPQGYEKPAGAAVVFRQDSCSHEWTALMLGVGGQRNISEAELVAIKEAVKLSVQKSKSLFRGARGTIKIFSDSKTALRWIGQGTAKGGASVVVRRVHWLARALADIQVSLELHWIPGHRHCVAGNIIADRAAKAARKALGGIRNEVLEDGPRVFSRALDEEIRHAAEEFNEIRHNCKRGKKGRHDRERAKR